VWLHAYHAQHSALVTVNAGSETYRSVLAYLSSNLDSLVLLELLVGQMPLLSSYQPCKSTGGVSKALTPTTTCIHFFIHHRRLRSAFLLSCILAYFILDLREFNIINGLRLSAVQLFMSARRLVKWSEGGPRTARCGGSLYHAAHHSRWWVCYSSRFLVLWGRIFFTCSVVKKNRMHMQLLGTVVGGIQTVTAKDWRLYIESFVH